jgi:hypothetical protein
MGTEALKLFINFLTLAVQQVLTLDDNKDGKVSYAEVFEAIYNIVPKLPAMYNNLPQVKKEIKDLTPEEINELVIAFQQEFDLPGVERDKLEAIIKKSVNIIAANYNYYRDMKAMLAA